MPQPHGISAAFESASARITEGIIAPISTPLGATSSTVMTIRAAIGSEISAAKTCGSTKPETHDSKASETPAANIILLSLAAENRDDRYAPAAVLSSSENKI